MRRAEEGMWNLDPQGRTPRLGIGVKGFHQIHGEQALEIHRKPSRQLLCLMRPGPTQQTVGIFSDMVEFSLSRLSLSMPLGGSV